MISSFKNKNKYENKKIYSKIEERTACKTCERLNKGTACWYKTTFPIIEIPKPATI